LMSVYELVGCYEFAAIDAGEKAESFKFRVEVLRELGKTRRYFARVYRRETFRVAPTYPVETCNPEPADHEFYVVDEAIGSEDYAATSKAAVLKQVKQRIESIFFR
jgi:hypothetical protein